MNKQTMIEVALRQLNWQPSTDPLFGNVRDLLDRGWWRPNAPALFHEKLGQIGPAPGGGFAAWPLGKGPLESTSPGGGPAIYATPQAAAFALQDERLRTHSVLSYSY